MHVAVLAACQNQVLRQMTCFVAPVPDPMHPTRAMLGAAPGNGERDALSALDAAIQNRDALAAYDAMERLNAWDLSLNGEHHD